MDLPPDLASQLLFRAFQRLDGACAKKQAAPRGAECAPILDGIVTWEGRKKNSAFQPCDSEMGVSPVV